MKYHFILILTLAAVVVCAAIGYGATGGRDPYVILQTRAMSTASTPAGTSQSASVREALSLASADLDGDGFPDLLYGFVDEHGGAILLYRDDPAAFAPGDARAAQNIANGRFPDPFRGQPALVRVPIAPDWLLAGDFDGDGNADVIVAQRDVSALYLLRGDGNGGLSEPQFVSVPGAITSIAAGEINKNRAGLRVALGVQDANGAALLVYDTIASGNEPVRHAMPGEVADLQVGSLDGDRLGDIAIVAAGQVLILHGRDTSGTVVAGDSALAGRVESVPLPFAVRSLVLGEFIADREYRTEMALLAEDGSVHVAAHGRLDQRPWSATEMQALRARVAASREYGGAAPVQRSAIAESWNVVEDVTASAGLPRADAKATRLARARVSSLPVDDLAVAFPGSWGVRVVHAVPEPAGAPTTSTESMAESSAARPAALAPQRRAVELAAANPVALLPMRLGVDARQGLVVLGGDGAPTLQIPVAAQTYHVTGTGDSTTACIGTSCPSLRSAIIASNANAGADTIVFDLSGTFTLTLTGSDNASAVGDLDINDSLTITGNGAASTIISTSYTTGCGDCKVIGVNQDGTHSSLAISISGVTIQNGFNDYNASCGGTFEETGGGVDFFLTGTGNSYSLANSTLNNNKADSTTLCNQRHGGGLNVDSNTGPGSISDPSAGTVTLNGLTVTNNTAQVEGGGVNLFGDVHNVTVSNCTMSGNTTSRLNGGGLQIRNSYGGTITVTNGTYSSNTAQGIGGGINVSGNNNVSITGATVSGNSSLGGGPSTATSGGGGVAFDLLGVAGFTPTVTMGSSTISGNHADGTSTGWGGGVLSLSAYTTTLSNLTISNNTARFGGGILEAGTSGLTTTLTGGSITGNTASQKGGGAIVASGNNASLSLSTLTISGNAGTNGGGGLAIINDITGSVNGSFAGTLSTSLSRIVNNSAASGTGIFRSGGTATVQNDWWGCDGFPNDSGCQTGSGTFNAVPRLDLRLTPSATTVMRSGASTLQARVDINSAGTTLVPTPSVLEGLTLTFASDSLGTVTAPVTANITSGAAARPWTAGIVPGTSTVSVSLDSGTQTASILITAPDMTLAKSHVGNFTQGQTGATYTLTATNSGNETSAGAVTVTDSLPAGFTATSFGGTGWSSCTPMPAAGPASLSCSRSDALAAATSYPTITLAVTVDKNAPSSITNNASVAGGNEYNTSNNSASDMTTIVQLADLTVDKSHTGNFTQSDTGKTYTVTVHNIGHGPTSGTVTVTDSVPAGLTVTNTGGTGWTTCSALPVVGPGTVTCTRSDTLAALSGYPALTLTVDVDAHAATQVTNSVAVSGGGEIIADNDSASDPTNIVQVPDLTIAKSHTGNFNQGQSGASYKISIGNSGSVATSGAVTVSDTLPVGLTATALSGTGWSNCTALPVAGPAVLTCSRSDALAVGNSYPDLTLTVDVAPDAAASIINAASVSGGGENNTANDSVNDSTTVNPRPDLTIAKNHTGDFVQGQIGAQYTITVTNSGSAAVTAGSVVTVDDTLPAGFTATAFSGSGWVCTLSPLRCTRSDGLAITASYPAITLTVNVATNAALSVQNSATVSGGGELYTANDTATDPTTVSDRIFGNGFELP